MDTAIRAWLVLAQAHVRVDEFAILRETFGDVREISGQPRSALAATGLDDAKCGAITSPDARAIDAALAWLDPLVELCHT